MNSAWALNAEQQPHKKEKTCIESLTCDMLSRPLCSFIYIYILGTLVITEWRVNEH
jgi:hypothetical protein